jgi:hypothetical protein
MATYNGHRNWAYWNVALWFGNDEGLYRLALDYKRSYKNITEAAKAILENFHETGVETTPDGAVYNLYNIRAAIKEL